jgi:hypothetical protein
MTRRDHTDDPSDKKLPVTGEVGSEGGSYADATQQVAQFEGDVGRTAANSEPDKGEASTSDATKYPTEP